MRQERLLSQSVDLRLHSLVLLIMTRYADSLDTRFLLS
jgi:hypothetical protein